MGSEEYDLLPVGNDVFRVQFDVPTPRAHFMLLPKIGGIHPDFRRMEYKHIQKMIEAAKSMLSTSGIPTGVLSIHRGTWFLHGAKSKHFHAHLCVDVEKYLDIFENRKDCYLRWPHRKYVTKEWKASKDCTSYAENVRGYPYKSYLDKEVAAIHDLRQSGQPSTMPISKYQGMDVVYHPSHPKVGFLRKKTEATTNLCEVLLALEKFAGELGLTNPKSKGEDKGCHICLYLGSANAGNEDWNLRVAPDAGILGYIVTAGSRFYKLCPEEHRQSWFEAFKASNFMCRT